MKTISYSPVRIPKTVICDKCKKPFESVTNEETCVQCMIKPSRRVIDFPPIPKEPVMPQPHNSRICIDCQKPYMSTSNVQKRCPDCKKRHKYTATKTPQPPDNDHALDANFRNIVMAVKGKTKPSFMLKSSMDDTIAIFHKLADAGCTVLIFGNTKISIEKV